jgi:hypothetical protein
LTFLWLLSLRQGKESDIKALHAVQKSNVSKAANGGVKGKSLSPFENKEIDTFP